MYEKHYLNKVQDDQQFVEIETEIMQHVLKME